MNDETKRLKSIERETVEYFRSLLPDEHDREYLSDADIEEMWGEYSRSMFASWLCHDSLTTDVALGMVRGWAAARYKMVDLENERNAAVQKIDRLREVVRLAFFEGAALNGPGASEWEWEQSESCRAQEGA